MTKATIEFSTELEVVQAIMAPRVARALQIFEEEIAQKVSDIAKEFMGKGDVQCGSVEWEQRRKELVAGPYNMFVHRIWEVLSDCMAMEEVAYSDFFGK